MLLELIPTELLVHILWLSLKDNKKPVDVLLVNKTLYTLGAQLLHAHLTFGSIAQLRTFIAPDTALSCPPRTITVQLPGGVADDQLFVYLEETFKKCSMSPSPRQGTSLPVDIVDAALSTRETGICTLETLSLRLNSHVRDPNLDRVYDALIAVNPQKFVWAGPDPSHHFSNAIVPVAAFHLFRALASWEMIQDLTLTNISFRAVWGLESTKRISLDLKPLKCLRNISLGQVTCLLPELVVCILQGQPSLQMFRVIDAYKESIWGSRVRMADVEAAVSTVYAECGELEKKEMMERVRDVVRCEMQTERIVGGDRMDSL